MDQTLETKIKVAMVNYLQQGLSLSDIQNRLNDEFRQKLTYMEIRILAASLPYDWKQPEPETATKPEQTPETDATPESAVPEEAEHPSNGQTVVSISKLARPGVALSGSVTFRNGSTGEWYVDQMGRLGLEKVQGDNPSQEDLADFQTELQKAVRTMMG